MPEMYALPAKASWGLGLARLVEGTVLSEPLTPLVVTLVEKLVRMGLEISRPPSTPPAKLLRMPRSLKRAVSSVWSQRSPSTLLMASWLRFTVICDAGVEKLYVHGSDVLTALVG